MTQVLIDRAALELVLRTLNRLRYDNDSAMAEEGFHEAAEALRAALANTERVESVPTRIERKVYKNSAEHSEYLSARFTKDKRAGSFEWQGHRWAYHWTSFDDEGDFDLIYRNTSSKDML